MRLLKVPDVDASYETLEMKEFIGQNIPNYAILSHTWTDDEVTLKDVENGTHPQRSAFSKVCGALNQARLDGYEWLWMDTCCIDKSSSAELQEAINSMYAWYSNSSVCYAYLADVASNRIRRSEASTDWEDELVVSRWFKRGWTLQELLAPQKIALFNQHWRKIGMLYASSVQVYGKSDARLLDLLSKGSKIAPDILTKDFPIEYNNVATRMSWAADRASTRIEDGAYCLMGIFGVNMPLLYGEGAKAFFRLQKEIMEITDDESILSWVDDRENSSRGYGQLETGPLAPSPSYFRANATPLPRASLAISSRLPHRMTNRGLHIELPLTAIGDEIYLARLNCHSTADGAPQCIYLKRLYEGRNDFVRILSDRTHSGSHIDGSQLTTMFIKQGFWPWSGGSEAGAFHITCSDDTLRQYELLCSSDWFEYRSYFDDDEPQPYTWVARSWDGLLAKKLFMGHGRLRRDLNMIIQHTESGEQIRVIIRRLWSWPLVFFAELGSFATASVPNSSADDSPQVRYEVVGTAVYIPKDSPRHRVSTKIVEVTIEMQELRSKGYAPREVHQQSVLERFYKLELEIESVVQNKVDVDSP